MTYTEASAECGIFGDCLVKLLYTVDKTLESRASEGSHVIDESVGFESGLHIEEYESSSESVVDHRYTSVGGIHKSDEVDISRYVEFLSGVQKLKFITSLIGLDKHKELTEDT